MEYISNLPVDFWITLGTIIATLVLGFITKHFTKLDNKKIPLQNMFIGLFVFAVQYLITKDLNTAVAISGIFSGGLYDVGRALIKLFEKGE
jgi:hypothetical protein